ncbi:MAG TPA: hypothetical protein VGD64_10120 [Acidisarcina sp.]
MAQLKKRNLTISLSAETVQKARMLAARHATSISGLVTKQIEALVSEDDAYERAAASAIARMKRGFHMGGGRMISRDEVHER